MSDDKPAKRFKLEEGLYAVDTRSGHDKSNTGEMKRRADRVYEEVKRDFNPDAVRRIEMPQEGKGFQPKSDELGPKPRPEAPGVPRPSVEIRKDSDGPKMQKMDAKPRPEWRPPQENSGPPCGRSVIIFPNCTCLMYNGDLYVYQEGRDEVYRWGDSKDRGVPIEDAPEAVQRGLRGHRVPDEGLSDCEQAKRLVELLRPSESLVEKLEDIVARNQNPSAGQGDGSFWESAWYAARDAAKKARDLFWTNPVTRGE